MNRTAKILWAIALAAIALYAVLYVTQQGADNGPPPKIVKLGPDPAPTDAKATKAGAKLEKFQYLETPTTLPEIVFTGPEGQPLKLESFRGKVVLLNVWATWCAPCRHEMPSLDRLQKDLGSDKFEVVALSIDKSGLPGVKQFLEAIGITHLKAYVDPTTEQTRPLKILGMPTTLLIDAKGREIGRLTGPAQWDSDAAKAIVNTALEQTGRP
ncbi:MAG: TlpA family protein disulfide reductase [Hyphomicrobiaceae bacterium]